MLLHNKTNEISTTATRTFMPATVNDDTSTRICLLPLWSKGHPSQRVILFKTKKSQKFDKQFVKNAKSHFQISLVSFQHTG